MNTIDDFADSRGWKLTGEPENPTYPKDGDMTIRRSAPGAGSVDLEWTDSEGRPHALEEVVFVISTDGTTDGGGKLHGQDKAGKYTVDVTLTRLEGGEHLAGTVTLVTQGDFGPEAGTWGADINGGDAPT